MVTPVAQRTDEKIVYARVHIDELEGYAGATSNDAWENAHQESSFYHLAGAVEGLLQEINEGHALGLGLRDVTWNSVRDALSGSGKQSVAFDELQRLRYDPTSWLAQLFEWRNHGTHRQRVGKLISITIGQLPHENEFKDPRTGQTQTVYPEAGCQDVLKRLANDVVKLIAWCRQNDGSLG